MFRCVLLYVSMQVYMYVYGKYGARVVCLRRGCVVWWRRMRVHINRGNNRIVMDRKTTYANTYVHTSIYTPHMQVCVYMRILKGICGVYGQLIHIDMWSTALTYITVLFFF